MAGVPGYRIFNVQLARKTAVSPSLLSLVFTGPDVAQMKSDSPDQRIKILLAAEDGSPASMPTEGEWYPQYLSMPKEKRPVMRTYTLRHVDAQRQEATVEFVCHGTEGPASAWAINAVPGDALQLVAPNAACTEDSGGYEWTPPDGLLNALIVADETALPAARGILEQLAGLDNPPKVQAFFEVPEAGDCVDLSTLTFADIIWLPRETTGAVHGECLIEAVKERARVPENSPRDALPDIEEGEMMWEKATTTSQAFFGWVAAESTVVKHLRRYLTGERGVDPTTVSFMAYWAKRKRGG
jgi:NADPH-dependent ferric siderophore reductase